MTAREILGVTWCPTCRVDTLPDARTGQCFFCDSRIADPEPHIVAARPTWCDECGTEIGVLHGAQRFCSRPCKDRAWRRGEAGQASVDRFRELRRLTRPTTRAGREAAKTTRYGVAVPPDLTLELRTERRGEICPDQPRRSGRE